MELIKGNVKVELVDIGEGICGDYNSNDPNDISLLRFYVSKKTEDYWEDIEDSSYCTRLPSSINDEEAIKALSILMDNFYDPVMNSESVKKLGERMSWISLDDIK